MSLSPAEAAKHVGLTKQSIIKGIRSGRVSATKDNKGEWRIEPVELFRVWPAVNQDTGKVVPQVYASTHPVDGDFVASLKGQIDLLKAQLDDVRADREDVRADRNHWRQIAERGLLTDQRPASEQAPDVPMPEPVLDAPTGFWARLFGR